jgi:hypothetical protein
MLKNNLPPGVFYVPATDLYNRGDWSFDPVKISALKDKHLSIIDYSTENYNHTLPEVYDYFDDLDINFILLSHNPAHHLLKSNLLFYPYYYHWTNEQFAQFDVDVSGPREFKIASLSRRPDAHRIINYIQLKDKPYFNNTVITAHRYDNPTMYGPRGDEMLVPTYIQTIWDQIYPTLPIMPVISVGGSSFLHPGYTKSYVNLIVETTVTKGFFISEKTWKPILRGQLFLAWGNVGVVAHLRDMGVDVFDDFIDHKYYDTEQDPFTRLNKIHAVLDELAKQDLDSIFQQTLLRRMSNIAKFKNDQFGTQYQHQIKTCINLLN